MAAFLVRRLLALLLVLFAVVTITFFMLRLAPGGPFDRDRKIPESIERELKLKYNLEGPEGRAWGESLAARLGCGEGSQRTFGEAGSLLQQYGSYLRDLGRGDLRISTQYLNRSVAEILAQTLPVSLTLGALAFLVASVTGVWLGTFAAVRHNGLFDAGAMFGALVAISVPTFVTGPRACWCSPWNSACCQSAAGGRRAASCCQRSCWPRRTWPTSPG